MADTDDLQDPIDPESVIRALKTGAAPSVNTPPTIEQAFQHQQHWGMPPASDQRKDEDFLPVRFLRLAQ